MGKRSLSLVLSLFGGAALVYVAGAAAVVGVAGRNLLLLTLVLALASTGALLSLPEGLASRGFGQQFFAVLVYVLSRVVLAAIRAIIFDGIEIKTFLSSSGRVLASNAMLLSLVALGLSRLTNI